MSRQEEAVIVAGVLEGGMRLEWGPEDSSTIYVGSDPSCQWRVVADGVAAFHWQLCWYGRRLWMADVGPRRNPVPGGQGWRMAPVGVVLRLGGTVLVLEVTTLSAAAVAARQLPAGPSRIGAGDPTLMMHIDSVRNSPPSREPDPDTTIVVDADELRALPGFGPPMQAMALQWRASGPEPQPARKPAAPALSEMFVVPAEQVVAAPKKPGRLARAFSAMPARTLLLLLASAGTAAMVFLQDGHAEQDEAPPPTLPVRRPPPESDIEMRGVEPARDRAVLEQTAGRDLAAGRLEDALRGYRALLEAKPDDPVYRDFVSIIERQVKVRCARGGCKEEAP